jgi:hypothetical protein
MTDPLEILAGRLDDATIKALTANARELHNDGFRAHAQLILSAAMCPDDEFGLDRLLAAAQLARQAYEAFEAFVREWGMQ